MAPPPPAAQATGVTVRFGATTALDNAGISLAPGEVHALVGRNGAGKSTLVAVLTGLLRPDAGAVTFAGTPAPAVSDRQAWRSLVACVYQRPTVIGDLSVAENLFLNRQAGGGPIRWAALRRRAAALLAEYTVDVDPARPARDLSVEERQLVEIARALSIGARVLILDEPTARLDATAIERLFARLRILAAAGVAVLFISHHLQEVYQVCQTVTVLRDGRPVLTSPVAQLSRAGLVTAMTAAGPGPADAAPGGPGVARESADPVLWVSGLSLPGSYEDFELTVHAGELVGIAGSGSSGKVALAETIAGLRRAGAGTISVAGLHPTPGSVPSALRAGIGFLPQDRHRDGLIPLLSVAENATLPIADRLGPAGLVLPGRRRAAAEEMISAYDIKVADPGMPVGALSGGNAQKVVLARALSRQPQALVLVSPTAGVDVRSQESLLAAVAGAARRGAAVLIVSDELDDVRDCDRVLAMFHGRVVAEFRRGWRDADVVAAVEGVRP